jgi:uncharacterized coiled-coil protein SlyX
MSSVIFKGLTVAAGLGLAIGIGSGSRRAEENRMGTQLPDDGPEAGPIVERLDRIEARISAIEARPRISSAESEPGEIDELHAQVTEHRKKVAVQVAAIEKRFELLAKEIPAVLESIVGPRVDDLRRNLRAEVQQSVGATLAKFERTISTKLVDRVAAVEKSVREQSVTVNALSRRAVESDANVQRLVAAVERLCTGGTFDPAALREPSFADMVLKDQANPVKKRKPATPVQPIEFESKFQHQIISEEEPDPPKHHRRPMARL